MDCLHCFSQGTGKSNFESGTTVRHNCSQLILGVPLMPTRWKGAGGMADQEFLKLGVNYSQNILIVLLRI